MSVATATSSEAGTPRPDRVLVVMSDQQQARLSAREGFGVDCTPAVDALARSGAWFDRAYTSAPVCVPARTSLLTGRFPSAHRVRENAGAADSRHEADLFSLARDGGLQTALIGKNHTFLTPDRVDHWVEFGHLGQVAPPPSDPAHAAYDAWLRAHPDTTTSATPHPLGTQLPVRVVDEAIDWLDRCGDDPSLLWLSVPEPHVPYQLPEPYFSEFTPRSVPPPATDDLPAWADETWQHVRALSERSGEADRATLLRARASYVGMIRLVDDQLARLFTHLRETGRLERTLVVVLADHGDFAGEHGLMRKGPGLPEVLTRIPFVLAGPGIPAHGAQPQDAHVSIIDVLPTVCDLLGWERPDGVQGRSLAPLLSGDEVPAAEFASVLVEQGVGGMRRRQDVSGSAPGDGAALDTLGPETQSGSMRAVRAGDWKLVLDAEGRALLFDLGSDPLELTDLAADPRHEARLGELALLLATWTIRADDPLPVPDGGYPRLTDPHGYHWTDELPPARGAGRRP